MLTTYGWVDKEKGIVRVPIDSAIALVLRRGFPGGRGAVPVVKIDTGALSYSPTKQQ